MKYYILIITSLIFIGCNKDSRSDGGLPPPNDFEIGIVDIEGNQLINNTYIQDSFRLYNLSTELYLKPHRFKDDSSRLQIWYPNIVSGDLYFIQLDENTIDTLAFEFEIDTMIFGTEVVNSYTMQSLFFNGVTNEYDNVSRIFDVVKN